MSGLIWIQIVWHSDNIPERILRKSWFWKNISRMMTKRAWKNYLVGKKITAYSNTYTKAFKNWFDRIKCCFGTLNSVYVKPDQFASDWAVYNQGLHFSPYLSNMFFHALIFAKFQKASVFFFKKMYKGMQSSIESKTILNELIPIDHFLKRMPYPLKNRQTALSNNWSWKPICGLFESGLFRQVLPNSN